MNNLNVVVLLT